MKNKGGRPVIAIDQKIVEQMAEDGCSNRQIAAFCQCSEDTLERRFGGFAGVLAKKRAERQWKLHAAQYNYALAGNATLLIFIGKQELGQADVIPDIPWDDLDANDLKQIEQGVLPFKLRKKA